MLRIQRLPEVLEAALYDGIDGAVLITAEGSILCSKFTSESDMNETKLAAISSNIWNSMSQFNPDITMHMLRLEEKTVAITLADRTGYLIAVYGSNMGMLRGRLESLSIYFGRIFAKS